MTKQELIGLLCCPRTRQRVAEAPPDLLRQINERIAAGNLKNSGGRVISDSLTAALVTADGKYMYSLRDSIPVMLWEESIPI